VEACSPGPYLELFSRGVRPGWECWGIEAHNEYRPTWNTYANNSTAHSDETIRKARAC
jgi:N6-adenosine-specific RNA methylase IME4